MQKKQQQPRVFLDREIGHSFLLVGVTSGRGSSKGTSIGFVVRDVIAVTFFFGSAPLKLAKQKSLALVRALETLEDCDERDERKRVLRIVTAFAELVAASEGLVFDPPPTREEKPQKKKWTK